MSSLLGLGMALPERRVENEELSRGLGRPAGEIAARSGVTRRFYAADGEGPSDLARRAAESALREAGLEPADVELIVFATMTPDVTFPGSGCYLQRKLGCRTIGALDIRAQCSGFVFALEVASRFLLAGTYRRVLVAGGDVHSTGLDFSPAGADVTPLYGDGAVVAILGAEGSGLLRTHVGTDASRFEQFWCEFPSSRRVPTRFLEGDFAQGRHYPKIEEEAVRSEGRSRIREAIERTLDLEGLEPRDVKRFFLQHVYRSAALGAAEDLGIADRTEVGGGDTGHVSSASLGISLVRARKGGSVAAGDLVCLATAGAGSTWGAMLLRL